MGVKIVVEALVDRERQAVWQFFNQPEHIINWNFASDDWCCPRAENDLRVGGRLCSRMEAKDGSLDSTSRRSTTRLLTDAGSPTR